MNRITVSLASLLLASLSLSACAKEADQATEPAQATQPAATATTSAAADVESATSNWVEGQHYALITPAQPTSTGDRVEVVEVFSYGCVHCATFQPYVHSWEESKPDNAGFVQMPAIFNPEWDMLARIFYTAEVLDILDTTHQATFDRIHRERQPFRSLEQAADFYVSLGAVERDVFLSTAQSFAVNTKHSRARSMVPRYGVEGTPTVIVAGKYRISGASAGSFDNVWKLVDYLVAKEQAASDQDS